MTDTDKRRIDAIAVDSHQRSIPPTESALWKADLQFAQAHRDKIWFEHCKLAVQARDVTAATSKPSSKPVPVPVPPDDDDDEIDAKPDDGEEEEEEAGVSKKKRETDEPVEDDEED